MKTPEQIEEKIKEFDKIWGEYPKNHKENMLGLDAIIRKFLSNSLLSAFEAGRESARECVPEFRVAKKGSVGPEEYENALGFNSCIDIMHKNLSAIK